MQVARRQCHAPQKKRKPQDSIERELPRYVSPRFTHHAARFRRARLCAAGIILLEERQTRSGSCADPPMGWHGAGQPTCTPQQFAEEQTHM
eukprot:scaffold201541_cov15-Tisochrysis_lutea.AAC.1